MLASTVDRWLKKHYRDPIDLPALAGEIGITPFLLCRLYRERSGKTLRLKQREIRITHAAKLLSNGERKVGDVARAVGYGSVSHFTKAFLEEKGTLPSIWKSRPRIVSVPETAGSLPPPGLTFVRATMGEVPPELSYESGQWMPARADPAPRARAGRGSKRSGKRWQEGNAFLD
ncbi:helix-turn-helix transcriptional regulator [Luteolibacter arcticus]|uniref:Helix-turn-helix transcriptional regulator n=1 Tax=Luteolibacter arcticus TaxID=1581411 RepID=A0ABT3GPZ6_9BACT|nr:helix-turn-helix transcriptional regulator [Luteolibacter arcticus]MCW1925548.1 helix-turn-helix transcriptional regulator [Luteolibacter arcticus]